MPAYKKEKTALSSLYGLMVTQFLDLDTCCNCGSHSGPFTWVIKQGRGHKRTFWVCDECYDKIKGAG